MIPRHGGLFRVPDDSVIQDLEDALTEFDQFSCDVRDFSFGLDCPGLFEGVSARFSQVRRRLKDIGERLYPQQTFPDWAKQSGHQEGEDQR
jgi:hypothetical protein